jgi:hypothetical protein
MGFLCMDFWSDLLIFVFVWILKCNGFRMFKAARSHQLRLCLARALVAEQAGDFGGILRQSVDQETWETALPIQKPCVTCFSSRVPKTCFLEHKPKRTPEKSVEIHFHASSILYIPEITEHALASHLWFWAGRIVSHWKLWNRALFQDPAGLRDQLVMQTCCPWQPMAAHGWGWNFFCNVSHVSLFFIAMNYPMQCSPIFCVIYLHCIKFYC